MSEVPLIYWMSNDLFLDTQLDEARLDEAGAAMTCYLPQICTKHGLEAQ